MASLNDNRFDPLDMSLSLKQLREPWFCFCLPLATGVCCGLVSLKTILIAIALIDITIGAATIGIGIIACVKKQLSLAMAAYIVINSVCFFLAGFAIYAIAKKYMKILKFYYIWKCLEASLLPVFELILLFVTSTAVLTQKPLLYYFVFLFFKILLRTYFAYLIYSYYQRLDRGESLLVEFG